LYGRGQTNVANGKRHREAAQRDKGDQVYHNKSGQPTDKAEEDGLEQKLEQDKVVLGTKRFLKANDARPLLDGHEHNIGDAEPTDEDGKPSDNPAGDAHHVEEAADNV